MPAVTPVFLIETAPACDTLKLVAEKLAIPGTVVVASPMLFCTVTQSVKAVGESESAISRSPTSTTSVKKLPAAVTTYTQPCLILADGLESRSGVLVAAL